jgi:hypothetical protein
MGIVRFALKFPYTFHVLDTFMSAHSSISDMMLQRRERRNGPMHKVAALQPAARGPEPRGR